MRFTLTQAITGKNGTKPSKFDDFTFRIYFLDLGIDRDLISGEDHFPASEIGGHALHLDGVPLEFTESGVDETGIYWTNSDSFSLTGTMNGTTDLVAVTAEYVTPIPGLLEEVVTWVGLSHKPVTFQSWGTTKIPSGWLELNLLRPMSETLDESKVPDVHIAPVDSVHMTGTGAVYAFSDSTSGTTTAPLWSSFKKIGTDFEFK
jgi:hypothetical protein